MEVEEERTDDENGDEGANEEIKQDKGKSESQGKGWMELLVMCAPVISFFTFLQSAFYYLSLDIPILLISIFPAQSKNFFSISLCLTWDTLIFFIASSWTVYLVFMIISFVLTFKDSVDLTIQKISR